ncbi:MAG TPA: hypothetical protein PLI27_08275 [Ignavibacteriales bacterium]|nr:hypothetical protein [Ignavibacteriales bacterium]HOL80453.1 hypothetical protein [Ignavibacteriales bacterium]HOM64904.1 hypothetical protein [Ignavibacteriales bacterium]HPD68053.1 hypothetical protein [Ignavibacteriales bacterium]HPP32642.1 hypothetical protein [Ignavibacteriales bacterium]
MKKLIIFLTALFFYGCSSIVELNQGTNIKYETIPELEVYTDNKISATASRGYLFHFIPIAGDDNFMYFNQSNEYDNTGYDIVKAAANFKAFRKAPEADLLVTPSYSIVVDSYFLFYKKVTVTVFAYPAKIRSFKNKPLTTN